MRRSASGYPNPVTTCPRCNYYSDYNHTLNTSRPPVIAGRYWRRYRCQSCGKPYWAGVPVAERDELFTHNVLVFQDFGMAMQRLAAAGVDMTKLRPDHDLRGARMSMDRARELAAEEAEFQKQRAAPTIEHIVDPEEVFAIIHPEIISD